MTDNELPIDFQAYLVRRGESEASDEKSAPISANVERIEASQLPDGDVTIAVDWSSANYKDALAAMGHPGVARRLPHIPGIDAAGRVVHSSSHRFAVGQQVIVTGNELGAGVWGGWSELIRVPAEWVVALPDGLTAREAMIHGTAGFTAAQCVQRLEERVQPDHGPIIVTGASGGVGCLAVRFLAASGYDVVASTGKADAADWLQSLGANRVISREEATAGDAPNRPMVSAKWAGAVDTVGGAVLSGLVRATKLHGCVTCCGMVGGDGLDLSVFPFILRGVTLAGITSQNCPLVDREKIWHRLANEWKFDLETVLARTVKLNDIDSVVAELLAGRVRGRTLVELSRA